MTQTNLPEHSQAEIILNALNYYSDSLHFSDFSQYGRNLKKGVDQLFTEIGDKIRQVHSDSRRTIQEYNGSDFSVQEFEVHSANIPLGNHYHKKGVSHKKARDNHDRSGLSEVFIIDEGSGLYLEQKLNPQGEAIAKMEEFQVRVGDILVVHPFIAHTLYLETGTKFRGFRPYPFDPKDMDLNPYRLEPLPR